MMGVEVKFNEIAVSWRPSPVTDFLEFNLLTKLFWKILAPLFGYSSSNKCDNWQEYHVYLVENTVDRDSYLWPLYYKAVLNYNRYNRATRIAIKQEIIMSSNVPPPNFSVNNRYNNGPVGELRRRRQVPLSEQNAMSRSFGDHGIRPVPNIPPPTTGNAGRAFTPATGLGGRHHHEGPPPPTTGNAGRAFTPATGLGGRRHHEGPPPPTRGGY